jgi:NAD(P)-dependent dehydrogenase (short-subunit alcohol dehydrogenase family)
MVTGGARGIGLATARAVLARGGSVVTVDVEPSPEMGDRVLALRGDVRAETSLRAAVDAAVERFGGLDVVIANAGVGGNSRPAHLYPDGLFERVVDVNLVGAWRTVHAALPHVGQAWLISSVYAWQNGAVAAAYAASKAGVEALGRSLRVELAPRGVHVGVAYFGLVDTGLVVEHDPVAARMFARAVPRPLRRQISAEAAAEALVGGIERRAARVVAPRRWWAPSLLRGVLAPADDARLARDPRVHALLRDADS